MKKWLLTSFCELEKELCNNDGSILIKDGFAVATHQAFILAVKDLSNEEKTKALENLNLSIDEAHKVCLIAESDDIAKNLQNNLGEIISFGIKNVNTFGVTLATGTFYRNEFKILRDEVKKKFTRYRRDFCDHFKTLGFKSFKLEYEECKTFPWDKVKNNILNEKKEKHFVVVPASGDKWRKDEKKFQKDFKNFKNSLKGLKVFDLVSQKEQKEGKKYLLDEPKKKGEKESEIDVVIVCKLAREGTDWVPCSRIHNTSNENSMVLAIQTMTRAFRRYEGKDNVKVIHYIKELAHLEEEGINKKDLLEARTNMLLLYFVLDGEFCPVNIPIPEKFDGTTKKPEKQKKSVKSVKEILGEKYSEIIKETIGRYEHSHNFERLPDIVEKVLEKKEVNKTFLENELKVEKKQIKQIQEDIKNGLLKTVAKRLLKKEEDKKEFEKIDIEKFRGGKFNELIKKFEKGRSFYFMEMKNEDWDKYKKIIFDIFSEEAKLRFLERYEKFKEENEREPKKNSDSSEERFLATIAERIRANDRKDRKAKKV